MKRRSRLSSIRMNLCRLRALDDIEAAHERIFEMIDPAKLSGFDRRLWFLCASGQITRSRRKAKWSLDIVLLSLCFTWIVVWAGIVAWMIWIGAGA